jgi:hypothetical protein
MFFVHVQRLRAALAGVTAVTLAAAVLPPPAAVLPPVPSPRGKTPATAPPYAVARRRQMPASADGAHTGSKEAASPMMKLQNRRAHLPGQQGKAR